MNIYYAVSPYAVKEIEASSLEEAKRNWSTFLASSENNLILTFEEYKEWRMNNSVK